MLHLHNLAKRRKLVKVNLSPQKRKPSLKDCQKSHKVESKKKVPMLLMPWMPLTKFLKNPLSNRMLSNNRRKLPKNKLRKLRRQHLLLKNSNLKRLFLQRRRLKSNPKNKLTN